MTLANRPSSHHPQIVGLIKVVKFVIDPEFGGKQSHEIGDFTTLGGSRHTG